MPVGKKPLGHLNRDARERTTGNGQQSGMAHPKHRQVKAEAKPQRDKAHNILDRRGCETFREAEFVPERLQKTLIGKFVTNGDVKVCRQSRHVVDIAALMFIEKEQTNVVLARGDVGRAQGCPSFEVLLNLLLVQFRLI